MGIVMLSPRKDFDRNFLPRHYYPFHLLCLAQRGCASDNGVGVGIALRCDGTFHMAAFAPVALFLGRVCPYVVSWYIVFECHSSLIAILRFHSDECFRANKDSRLICIY
jgi:hypothetical protein